MIDITEKKVPHLFRNKYLRNAGSGSVNASIQSPGQSTPGASVDIVKTDSATVPTDGNVLSSLRTLLEIRSRIIASTDTETAPSEENTLSSLRIVAEIDAAISEALEAINELYLSKTKADTAAEAITFLKGLFVGDNLAFINASGDAEVKNLVARMKAKVATLEVTGAASVESLTVGQTATTLNLLVQELADIYDLNVTHVATMFRTIIKDYVSSETFIPGLMGEGMKIYKALNGDWNLEIDNVVVRKVMTIFELVVSKIRSVNGGLVISPANGRIKSVAETTGDPTYYVLGIEGDNQFVADDLVRCQVFTSGHAKYYWVAVASVTADSILILKSEFTNGVVPAAGDDLIQMGNRTNTARQGLLYLTASEDGKPRFSVMDGVNSTSLVGKSKVILGCLDGMTDTDFPADFQPSGYGLYAMNVFLKGVFLLRNGKTVESEVESAKSDAQTAKDKADAVTRLFQEFTVAGGIFESKISEVKTYADGKVDGLQIGGRNLFLNSALGWSADRFICINTYDILGAYVGKKATISFDIKASISRELEVYMYQGSGVSILFTDDTCTPLADEYTRFSFTGNIVSANIPEGYTRGAIAIYDRAGSNTIHIRNIKIELGNKATDWTPAPEDVAADAQAKANAAQVAAEVVALAQANLAKTEASAYADGIVTAEEQRAIADAQAKLEEAKRDAQNKAEAAKNAAISDASGKYNTKSEVSSLISQTKNEINLSVSEKIGNVQNTAMEYANLSAKLAGAKMLFRDPTFKAGSNGINIYNNSGNGTVVISRVGALADNPTDSGYQIKITSNGYSNQPGRGGFYFGNQVHIYSEYICKFIAWIPIGSNVCFASNSIGDGGYQKWLTPTAGQGKWAEYVSYVRGGTANTSTTNFYNLDGGAETLSWWLCYATVFECSSSESDYIISDTSSKLQVLSSEISSKVSNTTFNALGNRVSSAETTITQHTDQISLKASQSDVTALGDRVYTAELKLDPSQIWLGIKSNVSALVPTYTKQIDTKGLDPNKYYLVTTRMSTTVPYTITVERSLNGSYGVPPYSTRSDGFSLLCKWQSNGYGWGTIAVKRIIQTFAWSFVDTCPVGSIGQIYESSEEIIYVRGGSVYNVRVDGTSYTDINLHTGTYTPYPDHPSSSRPGVADSVVAPVVDLDTKLTEEQVKAGIGITENGITVFGKFIDFTGMVTFNSLSWDAQGKITEAQTTANGAWNKAENLKNSLGGLAYANTVALARLDSTIIDGGFIKTSLIDVDKLAVRKLAAIDGTIGGFSISSNRIGTSMNTSNGTTSDDGMFLYNDMVGFNKGDRQTIIGTFSSMGYDYLGRFIDRRNNPYSTNMGLVISVSGGRENIALDMTGKIKTNGAFGVNGSYEIDAAWNNGWRKMGLSFTNGILTGVYWP